MINANELRIGNKLYFQPLGKKDKPTGPARVVELKELQSKSCIVIDPIGLDLELFYSSPSMLPIPLSPEILEKCGFEYVMVDGIARISDDFDEPEEGDTHNWTLKVKDSKHCDQFNFELVMWGKQDYFTFTCQWLRVRIKHLHQLQNLYFALTGTELTYNP